MSGSFCSAAWCAAVLPLQQEILGCDEVRMLFGCRWAHGGRWDPALSVVKGQKGGGCSFLWPLFLLFQILRCRLAVLCSMSSGSAGCHPEGSRRSLLRAAFLAWDRECRIRIGSARWWEGARKWCLPVNQVGPSFPSPLRPSVLMVKRRLLSFHKFKLTFEQMLRGVC